MARIMKQVIVAICDRCGKEGDTTEQSSSSPSHYQEWGALTVHWKGKTGASDHYGNGAESRYDQETWLCVKCTKEFISFIRGK